MQTRRSRSKYKNPSNFMDNLLIFITVSIITIVSASIIYLLTVDSF